MKTCEGNSRQSLMQDIQRVDFMLVDLTEYLDTHPNCTEALEEHANLVRVSQKLRGAYESQYGPLMTMTFDQTDQGWSWVDNPWPWDIQ